MVSDNTENSFVIVNCLLRIESYDDSCWRSSIHCTFYLWEGKHVLIISYELERCWQFTVINDVQKSIGVTFYLNFSKMYRLVRKIDVKSSCISKAWEHYFISSNCFNFVLWTWCDSHNRRYIFDSYFKACVGRDCSLIVINAKWWIFPVIVYFFNSKLGWY